MEQTEKKERILVAARDLFARFGLRKCSVAEIARAARVGKGTMYLYFSSKEEIFAAVVEREGEILLSSIRKQVAAVEDPAEKLRCFVFYRFDHLREMANLVEVSQEIAHELEPLVAQVRKRYVDLEVGLVREILELGKRTGLFEFGDSELVASVIVVGIRSLEFPVILHQFPGFLQQGGIEVMTNIIINGLKVR